MTGVVLALLVLLGGHLSPSSQDTVETSWRQLQTITREALETARRLPDETDQISLLVTELAAAHERFLQANPTHARAWFALAKLRVDQNDMAAADAAFSKAWSADPSYTGTGVTWAAAWMNRDSARGIAVLDQCIEVAPANLVLHINLVKALLMFDAPGIESRFNTYVQTPQGIETAATMLSALNRTDPDAASAYLDQLMNIAPNHNAVLTVHARIRRGQNLFGTARHMLERIDPADRNTPEQAYLYADTCYAEHDFEQANATMQSIDLKLLETSSPNLHRRLKFLNPLRQQAADQWPPEQDTRLTEAVDANNPIVVLVIDGQEVWCELFQDVTPNTVAAFLAVVEHGFHNDRPTAYLHRGFRTIFGERTDSDTMPQWTLPGEFDPATDRMHISGALCAFRDASRPDSADTRFYVLHFPAPHLHGHRTNFGRVISGLDVIRGMDGSERLDEIRIVRPGSSTHVAEAITSDGRRLPLQSLLDGSALDNSETTPADVNANRSNP